MECNFENCGYYVDEECTICGMGTDGEDTFCKYCKDNPNCYYKQLTKLKVENENLKQLNKELTHYLACMTEQRNKANTYLQEIKAIAEQSNVDCIYRISVIRKILTKAEEE